MNLILFLLGNLLMFLRHWSVVSPFIYQFEDCGNLVNIMYFELSKLFDILLLDIVLRWLVNCKLDDN